MSHEEGYWLPCLFKGRKVFAEAGQDGSLLQRGGRVAIVYRLGADKSYRTFADRLKPVRGELPVAGAAAPAPAAQGKGSSESNGSKPATRVAAGPKSGQAVRRDSSILGGTKSNLKDPRAVHLWTDGACSGNPGPAGSGTIVLLPGQRIDIATFLGPSTNNVAELTAILVGLRQLKKGDERMVVVHTDSQYSIGVLAKGWKAKSNVPLILSIQKLMERHPKLVWHWVRGHEGVALNEAADQLARLAVTDQASSKTITAVDL
jgi:ribonuclease HI